MLSWQQYTGLVICAIVVLTFFILLHYLLRLLRKLLRFNYLSPEKRRTIDHFLSNHFPYYRDLSAAGKEKFISRTDWFTTNKLFYGREGLEIDREMVLHVSACFTQLTFGLIDFRIGSYTKIFLYPDIFYSRLIDADVKGLTFKSIAIHLSWKNFKEGYENPNDKLNLGLHELAHALKFDLQGNNSFDDRFSGYIDDWSRVSESEFRELKNEEPSFLRAYGGANREEFFAVCVEHFFEAPETFQAELPDIYNHLCYLLNQNPQNKNNDYALTPEFLQSVNANAALIPVPVRKPGKNIAETFYSWSFTMFIAGLIIGIPVYIYFQDKLFIADGFFRRVALPVFIGGLLQSVFFNIRGVSNLAYFLVYNFIGFVFLTIALFVFTNYALREDRVVSEIHLVTSVRLIVVEGRVTEEYEMILKDNIYKPYKDVRSFDRRQVAGITDEQVREGRVFLLFSFSKGFWGIDNILEKEIIIVPSGK